MIDIVKRVRGALGTGLLWGGLGAITGVLGGVIGSMLDPASLGEWVLSLGLGFGGFGFLAGTGFAAILSLADGGRGLDKLSPGRAAWWGGLAGFVLPLGLVAAFSGGALPLLPAVASAAVFAGVTSLLGAGTVHVAQKGALIDKGDEGLLLPPTP